MANGTKVDTTEAYTINELIPRLKRAMRVKLPVFL